MTNPTITKFGYPATLVSDFDHWVVLVRQSQPTLGSLVLAAKSAATSYGDLPKEAFAEQGAIVRLIEKALHAFSGCEKINYLMLMMVDPNVHFHVLPRYPESRQWNSIDFRDAGWPGLPDLKTAVKLDDRQLREMAAVLRDAGLTSLY